MTSNYTITFSEFLELYENTDEWIRIKAKVQLINSNFPIYEDGNHQTYGLYNALVSRYKNREIGAETPQLFYDNFNAKCDFVYTKYYDKVNLYNHNIEKTTSRTVSIYDEGVDYNAYNAINPLDLEDTIKNERKSDTSYKYQDRKEQQMLSVSDNATILKRALEIDNLINSIIKEFESCFLCIY